MIAPKHGWSPGYRARAAKRELKEKVRMSYLKLSDPPERLGLGFGMQPFHRFYKQAFGRLYWKFMTGATVDVKWPNPNDLLSINGFTFDTSDPNEIYRPWLEENVGKQGRDWDWTNFYKQDDPFEIRIFLSRRKKYLAPMIGLMWQ